MSTRFVYAPGAKAHINAAARKVVEKAASEIASDAAANAPVDTGRLRDSITYEMTEDSAVVYSDVEYAPDVELGTSKMKAQPYLKPAAYKKRSL